MRRLLRLSLLALALAAPLAAEQWGFWDYGPGAFGDQAWKEPVANSAALPASGNETGDARITLDTFAVYVWDGNSWETAASGGGGTGTVTSVALAVPAEWTVSGSPVTTSGTITIAEATQTANTVYSGPATGAAAAPGFRALVSADIPNNAADTSGNAATATSATSAGSASTASALAANGSNCSAGQYPLGVDASGAVESCTAVPADTDDQAATEVPYTPTTGTNWTDPDPTHAGGGLDALAARLTTEEAKADDDVPESGDFGAAGDLEADGTLSIDTVAAAEMADADHGDVSWNAGVATVDSGAVGLTELADDATCTGGQATRRNAGDTAFECYTPAAGGIGGSTGATDERLLRADGAGGATAQAGAAVSLTDGGGLQIGGTSSSHAAFRGQSSNSVIGVVTANTVDNATPTMGKLLAGGFWVATDWTDPVNAIHTAVGAGQGQIGVAFSAIAGPSWNSSTTNAWGTGDVSLRRSAAGVLAVGDGQVTWGIGKLLNAILVEANTAGSGAPNVIAATESGTLFTNEGATAENYENLPAAVAGLRVEGCVQDADGMRFVAATGDTIRVRDKVTAAGGYVSSTTIGSCIELKAINATEWFTTDIGGVFTDGTFTYDDTGLTTP